MRMQVLQIRVMLREAVKDFIDALEVALEVSRSRQVPTVLDV